MKRLIFLLLFVPSICSAKYIDFVFTPSGLMGNDYLNLSRYQSDITNFKVSYNDTFQDIDWSIGLSYNSGVDFVSGCCCLYGLKINTLNMFFEFKIHLGE